MFQKIPLCDSLVLSAAANLSNASSRQIDSFMLAHFDFNVITYMCCVCVYTRNAYAFVNESFVQFWMEPDCEINERYFRWVCMPAWFAEPTD